MVRRLLLGCIQGFPLRGRLGRAVTPFPAPATLHVACGFPPLRASAHFTSRVMKPIRLERLPRPIVDTLRCTPRRVPVFRTAFPAPPLPAEALTFARSCQMSPNLHFYPFRIGPQFDCLRRDSRFSLGTLCPGWVYRLLFAGERLITHQPFSALIADQLHNQRRVG